jgi:hypothetical protein
MTSSYTSSYTPTGSPLASGTNGIISGRQFVSTAIDMITAGVQPGMKVLADDPLSSFPIGSVLYGTNGIANGTSFISSGVSFGTSVDTTMSIRLQGIGGDYGYFSIASVVSASELEIADTGILESGLYWTIEFHNPVTYEGLTILEVKSATQAVIESSNFSASGLTFEINDTTQVFDSRQGMNELASHNSKLYGVDNTDDVGGKLYEWNNSDAWIEKADTLNDQKRMGAILSHDGKLYGGTDYATTSGTLFEWNGTDAWVEVASQIESQYYINSLISYNLFKYIPAT